MSYDPIGPGTPAWTQFDLALSAWQLAKLLPKPNSRTPLMKSYHNHRAAMLSHVRHHNGDPVAWAAALNIQKQEAL